MSLVHLGLALMAKRLAPKLSLGWHLAASLWIDLVCTALLILGIERIDVDPHVNGYWPVTMDNIMISHSLFFLPLWTFVFYLVCQFLKGRVPGVLIALVATHWFIDLLYFRHDLPTFPFTQWRVGFGLIDHDALWMAIQLAIFILGITVYTWTIHSERLKVKLKFWATMVVITGCWLGMMITAPKSYLDAVYTWASVWALIPLGLWIDPKRPETYESIG